MAEALQSVIVWAKKPILGRVIIHGLQKSGRTHVLGWMKYSKPIDICPTCEYRVETVQLSKRVRASLWDVSDNNGGEEIRKYVAEYCDVTIFVVDSSDLSTISVARRYFQSLTSQLKTPVVILANKQDKPGALSVNHVAQALRITDVKEPCQVIATSCVTGQGFQQCSDLLSNLIFAKHQSNALAGPLHETEVDSSLVRKLFCPKSVIRRRSHAESDKSSSTGSNLHEADVSVVSNPEHASPLSMDVV